MTAAPAGSLAEGGSHKAMYTLIVEDKKGGICAEYSFETCDFIIGRGLQSDINLPSDNVSRRHARLFTRDGRCYVEDAGSANGVFLNGRRVQAVQEVGRSGQLKVGDYYLHIDSTDDAVHADAPVYCSLTGQNLAATGRTYTISRPVSILGRGRDCTTTVIDASVSRVHATLWVDGDGVLRIEDLKSANGTFINGQKIGTSTLEDGDVLRLGSVEFVVHRPVAGAKHAVEVPAMPRITSLVERPIAPQRPAPKPPRTTALPTPHADVEVAEDLEVESDASDDAWVEYRRRRRITIGAATVVGLGALAVALYAWFGGRAGDQHAAATAVATSEGAATPEAGAVEEPEERPVPSEEAATTTDPARPKPAAGAASTGTPKPARAAAAQTAARAAAPSKPVGAEPPTEMALLKKGEGLLREQKWAEARAIFQKLRDLDPLSPTYQSMFNKADLEARNQAHLLTGRARLEGRMFTEALEAFRAVTVQSAYRDEAQRQVQALLSRKDDLVRQGDELCAKKSWRACHDHYVDAYSITPKDAELARKIEKVSRKVQ